MTCRHRRRDPYRRLIAAGTVLGTVGVLLGVDVISGAAHAAPAPVAVPVRAPVAASLPAREPGWEPAQDPDPNGDGPAGRAAARARAEAAQRAAELAAKRAEAARKVRVTWESRGRPHRMAVVRPNRIDVVTDGRLTRQFGRSGGPVTINTLDRALPGRWLEVSDGTASLGATVVLTPGTALQIGEPVRRLELLGGESAQDAASIYTGGGRVTLNGVTVVSADPATGQAVAPTAAGRPFFVVSARGRLDAVDSTVSDLGTPSTGIDGGRAGMVFNRGSSGSLVRTTVQRNTTGIELSGSDAVHLEEVTFRESVGDGLVLTGDRGTTMSGIRAVGNGDNGVVVTGESTDRPITGITTSGNGGYGVVVIGQTGTRVAGIVTANDQAGGLRLNRSTDMHVTDFSATEQPTGVFMHVNSARIVLDHLRTAGGRRGIVAEKSTRTLEIRDTTIEGARVSGVTIGGKDILLNAVRVSDSRAGVRIERGASGVRLAGLVLRGGRDGVVATPGTTGVVIADLVADRVASDAVRSASADAEIIGGRITGGTTGIDVAAGTTISGVRISGVVEGIHSRSPDLVRADEVSIDAIELGVNAAPGSPFQLTGSSVHALEALRGQIRQHGMNDLSLPPLNLLSAIGLPLILLAVVLEQVHTAQLRRAGVRRRRQRPQPISVPG
jgi:hypothetical protein